MYAGRGWTADVGENPGMYETLSRVQPTEMNGHPIEEIGKAGVSGSREGALREAVKALKKAYSAQRYFGAWVGLMVAKLDVGLVYESGDEPDEHQPSRYSHPSGVSLRYRFFAKAVAVEALAGVLVSLGTEDGYALDWKTANTQEAAHDLAQLDVAEARSRYRENAKPGYSKPRSPIADIRKAHQRASYASMSNAVSKAYSG